MHPHAVGDTGFSDIDGNRSTSPFHVNCRGEQYHNDPLAVYLVYARADEAPLIELPTGDMSRFAQ